MREVEESEWYQHYLDTPLGTPTNILGRPPVSASEAMTVPGCAVKSIERDDGPHGFPKHHGRIKSIDGDRIVVIAHATRPPSVAPFVWEGTEDEFHTLWDCD
jgi:hypothetical protein